MECEATATGREYDHQAERAKLKPEELHKCREEFAKQYGQAYDAGVVDCAGKRVIDGEIKPCPRRLMLIWMYRCWFCGKWYCPVCAKDHFGGGK